MAVVLPREDILVDFDVGTELCTKIPPNYVLISKDTYSPVKIIVFILNYIMPYFVI